MPPIGFFGMRMLAVSARYMRYQGSFIFDGLVVNLVGLLGCGFAIAVFALAGGAVLTPIGLLLSRPTARTGALCYFSVGIPVSAAFLSMHHPLFASAALAGCIAGVVLLFLRETDRDFGGRWGTLLFRRS